MIQILILLAALLGSADALARTALSGERLYPSPQVSYDAFVDPTGAATLGEVQRLPAEAFRPVRGYDAAAPAGSVVWFKLPVRNASADVARWVATSLVSFRHGEVDVYVVRPDGAVARGRSGAGLGITQRALPSRALGAPFDLRPGEDADVFVRIASRDEIHQDFVFQPEPSFWKAYAVESEFLGFYMGYLAVIALTVLVYGARYRYGAAVWFGVVCLATVLETSLFYGFVPGGVVLDRIAACVAVAAAALFGRAFFQAKKTHRRVDRMLLAGLLPLAVSAFLALEPRTEHVSHWLFYASTVYESVAMLTLGVVCIRAGEKFSWLYLISRLALVCGFYVWLAGYYGLFSHSYVTLYSTALGQIVELTLPAVMLAFRAVQSERERQVMVVKAADADRLALLLRVSSHDMANIVQMIDFCALTALRRPAQAQESLTELRKGIAMQRDLMAHVRSMLTIFDESPPPAQPVDLADAAEDLARVYTVAAEAKGVRLDVETSSFAGLVALADRTVLVNSVLGNLVMNAIKFSPAGSAVRVCARATPQSVRIHVEDHGIGIPRDLLARLFETGPRLSRAGTAGETGAGFGMMLVKTYVERFGGRIEVRSVARDEAVDAGLAGTTVTVELRRADEPR